MADAAPDLIYSVDRAGDPIVIIERKTEAGSEEVLETYPGLISGEYTTELAKLVNHFAREFQYEVIEDPAAFEEAYMAQVATEDADANWQQGNPRLRDFGKPDFSQITVPQMNGQNLVYFAKSRSLGVPYRVDVQVNGTEIGEAQYEPMPMQPIE